MHRLSGYSQSTAACMSCDAWHESRNPQNPCLSLSDTCKHRCTSAQHHSCLVVPCCEPAANSPLHSPAAWLSARSHSMHMRARVADAAAPSSGYSKPHLASADTITASDVAALVHRIMKAMKVKNLVARGWKPTSQ